MSIRLQQVRKKSSSFKCLQETLVYLEVLSVVRWMELQLNVHQLGLLVLLHGAPPGPAVSHPTTCETLQSPLFLFPLIPERHTNAQSLLICNQIVTEDKEAVSEHRLCR